MQQASPFSQSPQASPFHVGGSPLFKTAGQEAVAAPPINSSQGMSPFNIAGTAPTNTPLTVGDVIGQLPPELVRAGALPLEQPLSLPPALLENALRGGQPALPVFELYRVCPALFQTPVSPQDPRTVPLPAAKLPSLIAKAREGQGNGVAPPSGSSSAFASPASPFGMVAPAPVVAGAPAQSPSPFQMARPAAESPAPASSAAFPMSPFAAVAPGFNGSNGNAAPGPAAASASPFTMQAPAPAAASASPFTMQAPAADESPAGSPFSFGKVESAPPAAASPFGMSPAGPPGAPAAPPSFAAAGSATPQQGGLTSLFTPKAPESASAPAAASAGASPFGGASPAAPGGGNALFSMPGNPASSPLQGATPFSTAAASSAAGLSSPFGAPTPGAMAPASPFASLGSSGGTAGAAPASVSSPFSAFSSTPAPAAQPAGVSPFANIAPSTPLLGASPFGAPQQQAGAARHGSSPFGAPASTAPAPAGASPFAATTQSEPAPAPQQFQQPQPQQTFIPSAPAHQQAPAAPAFGAPAFGAPASGTASSAQTKLGFAAVLHGFSAEDLGFNPAMAPAWITTQVPTSTLKEQIASGNVVMELGALIDGISDVGFRNTLSGARRDLQIKLPQNEVFHALTGGGSSSPPSAPLGGGAGSPKPALQPATSASNAFIIQPNAPAGQVSRVEAATPPNPFAVMAPVPSTSESAPSFASSFGGESPFGKSADAPPPETPAPVPQPATSASAAVVQPKADMSAFSAFGSPPAPPPEERPAPTAAFPQAPPAAAPLQPLSGAFKPFAGGASAFGAPAASPPTSSLLGGGASKPFDPFASSGHGTGSLNSRPPTSESGFSSAQLLGQSAFGSAAAQLPAFSTPPVLPESKPSTPASPPFGAASPTPSSAFGSSSFAPALEQKPASVPAIPLFSEPAPQTRAAPQQPQSLPQSSDPVPAAKAAVGKHSFLGLAPLDTQTDQLLLRALLGTEENLTATRVVELLASLPGLSACVCLNGSQVLSHADKAKPDAAEFQRQAPDISRQLRGLAPLIGIDGAETFTLNAGGRLLTFCFPGSATVGVLHDVEPTNGLRDKITLIARELARMLG